MYHPPDLAGGLDDTQDEYVELINITAAPVDLSGWVLRGDSDFVFPAGSILAPGGFVLLVSFDPVADATALAGFRATYSLGASAVLFGPYSTKLSNASHPDSSLRVPLRWRPGGDVARAGGQSGLCG